MGMLRGRQIRLIMKPVRTLPVPVAPSILSFDPLERRLEHMGLNRTCVVHHLVGRAMRFRVSQVMEMFLRFSKRALPDSQITGEPGRPAAPRTFYLQASHQTGNFAEGVDPLRQ